MYKYRFFNDYGEGAHPRILERLLSTNLEQQDGYGLDAYSQQAAARIQQAMHAPNAAVHFVSGGTQANQIVLSALLKPHEAVIAAESGHINVHEAGAIEATGHKVLTVPSPDGKVRPQQVLATLAQHTDEHMVKPKAVYISNSTEVGTAYTRQELEDLWQACQSHQLYLFLDGARLGAALTSPGCDLTLPDLARLVDILYIGGTKNGALLGEAIVINSPALQTEFRFGIKQRGGLLAKGRLMGIQFLELFNDDLYFELARQANARARQLAAGLQALGVDFMLPPTTNQIFPILPDGVIQVLQQEYGFYTWAPAGEGRSSVRLVTSWATPEEKVSLFLADLKPLLTLPER